MASMRRHTRQFFRYFAVVAGLSCAVFAVFNGALFVPELSTRGGEFGASADLGEKLSLEAFAVLSSLALVAGVCGWLITVAAGWSLVAILPSRRRRASAQCSKALMYRDGEGNERDYARAVKLFRKAAEAGDWNAQLNLGCMYGTGRGVPRDNVQCFAWWDLAAKAGSRRAQRGCEVLARQMHSDELQRARQLSNRLDELVQQ